MNRYLTVLIAVCLVASLAIAGTTGKIAGRVTDEKTGEPMIGVSLVLAGTTFGAASDMDGNYFINNIPPGTYILKASTLGYNPVSFENIRVNIDLTTRIDVQLAETVVDIGREVVITAERPLVQRDLTATTSVVGGDDIKALPVTEVSQVIGLQAGNVAGHLRGGRTGEVAYWIDGVPVTDVYDGSTVVEVNTSMVQELQVLSGAFNAEYGQAMSGIVNIATREGTEKFSGSITSYLGDFLSGDDIFSNNNGAFRNIEKFDPLNIYSVEGSLSGPILGSDLSFFINGRHVYFGGYKEGIREYTPSTVTVAINDKAYVLGSNRQIDSLLILDYMSPGQKSTQDSINFYWPFYYNYFKAMNPYHPGDNARIPMDWNRKNYIQAKISAKFTPQLKLNTTFIMDKVTLYPYDRFYQLNPDGRGLDYRNGLTSIVQLSHTLSGSTYYTLAASWFEKSFRHYLYENPHDSRYIHPNLYDLRLSSVSYPTGGTDLGNFYRMTTTYALKFDLSSQITSKHFVKGGLEARQHRVFLEDITLKPIDSQSAFTVGVSSPYIITQILPDTSRGHDRYAHFPVELSGYLQDKMEFDDLIINIGMRVDYFQPDAQVLTDDEDPEINNPKKESNKYFDLNGNGVRDANEPLKTVADREKDWYKDAAAKIQISPRFGASFPITDRGIIHFSYGHFFQIPNFQELYQNPRFKVGTGTGNVDLNGKPTGNADLQPEQTINGEIGLQQQLTEDLSMDVTVYLRDIRNLSGTRADQITIGGEGGSQRYTKFVNSDFGFVKGFIVSLDKRFGQGLAMSLDYTFQIAKGSASSSNEARDQLANGILPEVQLAPLGWDQRHTLNGTLSYSSDSYGGSIVSQYGSGSPYTPTVSKDVTAFLNNSQTKPTYFNTDVRMYKMFDLDPLKLTIFLRINNIFDRRNENEVYGDTGRAGKTYDEDRSRQSKAAEYVNSIHDYYLNPSQYSEPRRIEIGATVEF